jgi:sulfane dehydrogenase subunit SoxC
LTYDDLLRLPSRSVACYIECAGNGRSFFKDVNNQPAKGTQWRLGAYGVVEYSLNGGASWAKAALREPNIPRAGVKWDFAWEARPGAYTIMTRATDDKGNTQPLMVPWNELGYEFWAALRHPVTVG